MKIAFTVLLHGLLLSLSGAANAPVSQKRYTVSDLEAAILSGKLGTDLAASAQKIKKHGAELYVREMLGQPVPYQLFTFDLSQGYTVLIESSDKIVILCSAFGGGYVTDIRLTSNGTQKVLHYRYTSGSGRRFEHTGEYVVGSGSPKEVAPVKDTTPR
jgi:hypothetical protein